MRLTEGGGGFGVQYLTPDLSSALDRQNELERQRQALLAAQRVLDRQQANMAQQDQVFAPAPAPQQGPPVPPGFGAPSPGIDYSAQPVQGPPLPPHFNAPLTGSDFQPSQSPNGILSTNFLSLIHISEPTRLGMISYAVFCLKKKKKNNKKNYN